MPVVSRIQEPGLPLSYRPEGKIRNTKYEIRNLLMYDLRCTMYDVKACIM
jgi:hypothetical protein